MIWLSALGWGLMIGAVLGLLGGGGALISIPILLYVFHFSFAMAVGTSLLLVLVGALPSLVLYAIKRQVDWQSAFWMGASGSLGAAVGSQFSASVPPGVLLYLLIALILISVWRLLQPGISASSATLPDGPMPPTVLQRLALVGTGLAIGVLTGLVGVGGGFLIVPALIMVRQLEPRKAIATSLLIITINASAGMLGYWQQLPLTQPVVGVLIGATLLGSLLGFQLSFKISQAKLKQGFALLLLLIAVLLFFNPPIH
ncbi:sulfite exporter TauE/SafE family protein [Vampirovibrio sp.]|uniref:sulfite exporter TauE/SafE family protein n=1 Tax=Vampirovibrio sp. TaxID=2717857 RepID=UPI0035930743